ncbi:MAG: recombination-associated protein RdgC [Thiomargarita sp.]|nr:recombination-associated protein RdgC [Thiomargarita sp.]
MWFKNIHIYRFLRPFTLSAEELHEELSKLAFQPCGKMDMESMGWSSPLGNQHKYLVHTSNKCIIFCARKEEKLLPASVARAFINDKIEEVELQQMRRVNRHEKEEIREQVLSDLIPRAFARSQYLLSYIDVTNGWLIIDSASDKKAEELVTLLRRTLETLPVVFPIVRENPATVMTKWLVNQNHCPADFELADACVLADPDGAIVHCKRQDLLAEEMQGHLEAGKLVQRLSIEWNDRLSLILDNQLIIRRFQALDLIQTQLDDVNPETPEQRFDADFAILNLELVPFIKRLFEVFGGEDEEAYAKMR